MMSFHLESEDCVAAAATNPRSNREGTNRRTNMLLKFERNTQAGLLIQETSTQSRTHTTASRQQANKYRLQANATVFPAKQVTPTEVTKPCKHQTCLTQHKTKTKAGFISLIK